MISSIELRSFKCFELLRLPLTPLTLLTGLNASGKSSVLQALVLLHQTMREHEWSTRLILNGSAVRLGSMPDVIDKISGRNRLGIALEENESNTYAWTFGGDRRDMSLQVLSVTVNGQTVKSPTELHYLLPPGDKGSVAHLASLLRGLTYITAERIAPQEAYDLQDPHVVKSVGPRGEHAVSVLHWGRDEPVPQELSLPSTSPILLRQVVERMRQFFPGFNLDLQQAQGAFAVSLGLLTSEATGFHSPTHTGFGLTQVLPIVVAVLSASKDDLILIENPEVHLHPAGQALIGQFMGVAARAGLQMVVETHSDHVLNGVRRAVKSGHISSDQVAIHFFRPRSEELPQVVSPSLDETGNIDDWPEGFFDQFDKDSNYFAGWTDD